MWYRNVTEAFLDEILTSCRRSTLDDLAKRHVLLAAEKILEAELRQEIAEKFASAAPTAMVRDSLAGTTGDVTSPAAVSQPGRTNPHPPV